MGFSTRTVFPSSKAWRTGKVCSFSLVETITAFTSGREITSRLLPEEELGTHFLRQGIGTGRVQV